MRTRTFAALAPAIALALAACGGGTTVGTGSDEPTGPGATAPDFPTQPGETGFPTEFATGGAYSSGRVTGDISGATTATLDVPISTGLAHYTPGSDFSPQVITLQYGNFDPGPHILLNVNSTTTEVAGFSLAIIVDGTGYATDSTEAACTVTLSAAGADRTAGTMACTGIPSDDGSQTIDVNAEFEALA